MVSAITQWAITRPLAGYSVAILMTPKGIIHVWTESQGIFAPGDRKWTCEDASRSLKRGHLRPPSCERAN